MFIEFDPARMFVSVRTGAREAYQPTEEVLDIEKKVTELRDKMIKFQKEIMDPGMKEIQDLVAKANQPPEQPAEDKKEEPKQE